MTLNRLSERITQTYPELTAGSRRIADYLQRHPDKVLMMSTSEIAEQCDVSKTSVSRFIRRLGYEDHTALRQELLQERERGQPVRTTVQDEVALGYDIQALEHVWTQLNTLDLQPMIEKIARAKRVKVVGYRNSYPLAMHCRQQLMQCRGDVDLLPLPGQTIGEDLASIGEDDFVIVIGIRRRVAHFPEMMTFLAQHACLLITDQSGQKYAQHAQHMLICPMDNTQPFDSYAAPMSLIAHLVNQTFFYLNGQASQVSQTISQHYAQLNELET